MTFLIDLILRLGVPERLAKPLLGLIALIALAGLLWGAVTIHDRRVITASDAQHEAKLAPVIAKAGDNAAAQRSTDTIATSKTEQGAHDAIAQAPETAPSPAAVQLACDRLRRARADVSAYPACRRP
jgi:hypothetical protein